MMPSLRDDRLLGSYQEEEYSHRFQKMMNNAIGRILRGKAARQTTGKTLSQFGPLLGQNKHPAIHSSYFEAQQQQRIPKSIYSKPTRHQRTKTSPTQFSTHSNYKLPSANSPFKCKRKLSTEPHSQFQENLYRKLGEYNTCLITRTYRFKQKEKLAICISNPTPPPVISLKSEETSLFTKKIESSRKENKWLLRNPKILKIQQFYEDEVVEGFFPWESKYVEDEYPNT